MNELVINELAKELGIKVSQVKTVLELLKREQLFLLLLDIVKKQQAL